LPFILTPDRYKTRSELTKKEFQEIKNWFDRFTITYLEDEKLHFPIKLKIDHILNVVDESEYLSTSLNLSEDDIYTAKAIGLLHDIGRLPQIKQYGTFSDRQSENHAFLGLRTINENKILSNLSDHEQLLIRTAIANHNRFSIATDLDEDCVQFCQLIRDADKLDIWNVLIETDKNCSDEEQSIVYVNLPETDRYNPNILTNINRGNLVSIADVKVRNDFRLLALAWIYDLNFLPALKAVKDRNYFERLTEYLPADNDLRRSLGIINNYIEYKLTEG